jgi:endonuclease/exonuclease/phosphatase family metal-dependent hydrolase
MANPIEDRFDYVFISDEIGVTECSYDYQGARVAGSDHGIATAELQLC